MNSVAALISSEISRSGPVSFARFMQLALYSPEGYYERRRIVGRQGDFYTSVSVGSLFGELLAFQFGEWMTAAAGCDGQIVESGAHDGRLADDMLTGLARSHPMVFRAMEYWIIEPSPERQAWQEETLGAHLGRVKWWRDWTDVPSSGVHGIIFSNE
ncbi:MAG: SAM-dependent methyltransferase, partial [Opitutaceae bacterium]|nr:SAM-dependent methyltransferase [Verrucomicrobiales bacterium]